MIRFTLEERKQREYEVLFYNLDTGEQYSADVLSAEALIKAGTELYRAAAKKGATGIGRSGAAHVIAWDIVDMQLGLMAMHR